MKDYYKEALIKHEQWKGKITTSLNCSLENQEDLSLAYTPGVAQACKEIEKDKEAAYKYTWKGNVIAVVSDGSAVLGLGNIGAEAALPVMEGKAALFKKFANVNAVPLVLDTQDTEEIIATVKAIAPSFGGINLEDISAPRCVEIERRLIDELDIPVFHDDQHGTAIVVTAGLINALKVVNKKAEDCTVTVSGAGAAGYSIIRMIKQIGVDNIYCFDSKGLLNKDKYDTYNFVKKEIVDITNKKNENLSLAEAMEKSDIFIGVSSAGIVKKEMVSSMKKDAIVFALANPEPEINYYEALEAGARVVASGRSDFPNQINNVLAFPGLFKGALEAGAVKISENMKMAAAVGIAEALDENEIKEDKIIPQIFEKGFSEIVAEKVKETAIAEGLVRNK
jgi:malate dehydrogenase (oxaloacetate-decarboxylating)